jgi:hypothetical protein
MLGWLRAGGGRWALRLLVAAVAGGGAPAANAMTFKLVPDPSPRCTSSCAPVMVAEGEIKFEDDEDFLRFLEKATKQGKVARVLLIHSPGGFLGAALKIGIVARELKLAVVVARASTTGLAEGECYSACAFVVMGGAKRIVPPSSKIGVHRSRPAGVSQLDRIGGGTIDPVRNESDVDNMLRRYARYMGISPEIVTLAGQTPPTDIHILTRAEMARFRLAREKL